MATIDLIAMLIFVAIGLSPSYLVYRLYQQKKFVWRQLAEANGLTYVPPRPFKPGNFITGVYRGYEIHLDSIKERLGNEEGQTQLTLARLSPPAAGQTGGLKQLQILNDSPEWLRGKISRADAPVLLRYHQAGIEADLKYLQSLLDWLVEVADAYQLALTVEGKAIPILRQAVKLKKSPLQPVVRQLLDEIERNVTTRLQADQTHLFCLNCLTIYQPQRVELSLLDAFTYHGCRLCQRSDTSFEGRIVAVLDAASADAWQRRGRALWVNWLVTRQPFDFDEIRLERATDEAVERFAVQIGNDTDPLRTARYKQIPCLIGPECRLSANTLRILERMVGRVEVRPAGSPAEPAAPLAQPPLLDEDSSPQSHTAA